MTRKLVQQILELLDQSKAEQSEKRCALRAVVEIIGGDELNRGMAKVVDCGGAMVPKFRQQMGLV